MATQIKLRRDTDANWIINSTVILAEAEIGVNLTNGQFKLGDGTSTWAELTYFEPGQGGSMLPADASGYLTNDGAGNLSWAAGDGTFSGNYTDLTNKPTIPAAQIQSDWTQSSNAALDYIKNKPALFSGSYSDLTNKPTIPTNTNQLTNGAGFITSDGIPSQTGNTGKYLTTDGTTLSWATVAGGDANLGDITVENANTLTIENTTLGLRSFNTGGSEATIKLDAYRIRSEVLLPNSNTYNAGNGFDLAEWVAGEGSVITFTNLQQYVVDFINRDLDNASNITVQLNGTGPEYQFYGFNGTNQIYISTNPDTDPTAVTEIRFSYEMVSKIDINPDDGALDIVGAPGVDINITAGDDLYMVANDRIRLTAGSDLRLRSGDDYVTITTNYNIPNATQNNWYFSNNGKLELPPGGDIVDSTGASVLGGSGNSSVTTSTTAPSSPSTGDLWYDTISGRMYVYFDSTWVDSNPVDGNTAMIESVVEQGPGIINYGRVTAGTQSVEISTSNNGVDNAWLFYNDGSLTLPNNSVIQQSTNAEVTAAYTNYTNAIADWETARITDYLASVNSVPGLTIEGWPFAGWNDVSGTTAQAYLDIVNEAWNIQQAPSSPPQALIFTPALSQSLRTQLRASLTQVIGTYAVWQALLTSVDIVAGAEKLSLLSNNKIQVPGIIQTDVEEDLIIRARYAGATSPSGTTTVNQDFIFGTNGSLTMPNSGSITTTHLNTNFLNYQTNGTLQVGHEGGGNVIVATDRFQVLSKVPTSSKGSAGDTIGCVAFDATYIYYCSGLYNGTTDIWHRVVWTDNSW